MSFTDLRNNLPPFIYDNEIREYCDLVIESERSEEGFLDWLCKIPLDLPESN